MMNLTNLASTSSPAAARGGASRGVDIANPIFGIGTLMLLTVVPYFYPIYYVAVRKYWSFEAHLSFSAVLLIVNLSLYVLYSGYLRALKSNLQPIRYTADFADVLLFVSRCAIWIAMLANTGLVLYVLPHYSGSSPKMAMGELGGVNILSQLHVCFLGPFIGISIRRKSPWKLIVALLSVSLIARSFVLSERMALLEMMVPLIVILCLYRRIRVSWLHLALMLLAVPIFFVAAELMRSFYAKFVAAGGWGAIDPWFAFFWNFERFFIYYIDVINKFYFILENNQYGLTHYWFGGIASIFSNFGLTEDPKQQDFSPLGLILDATGVRTPEMTNIGGFSQLFTDFGWWGVPVYLGLVILLFATHAGALRGSMLCVGLYPLLFLNFTDMARRIILYESRALFPLTIFLVAYAGIHLLSSAVPVRLSVGEAPASRRPGRARNDLARPGVRTRK
jgi:hypothetical protein